MLVTGTGAVTQVSALKILLSTGACTLCLLLLATCGRWPVVETPRGTLRAHRSVPHETGTVQPRVSRGRSEYDVCAPLACFFAICTSNPSSTVSSSSRERSRTGLGRTKSARGLAWTAKSTMSKSRPAPTRCVACICSCHGPACADAASVPC